MNLHTAKLLFILAIFLVLGFVFSKKTSAACEESNGHNVCEDYGSVECTGSGPWTRRQGGFTCDWCTGTGGKCSWVSDFSIDCGGCSSGGGSSCESPQGYIEQHGANCTSIYGWAGDKDGPASTQIDVHFYADGTAAGNFMGFINANAGSEQPICDFLGDTTLPCRHRYIFPTPLLLKDGLTHTMYAFGINSGSSCDNTQLKLSNPGQSNNDTYEPALVGPCGVPNASVNFTGDYLSRTKNNVQNNDPLNFDAAAVAAGLDTPLKFMSLYARPCNASNNNCVGGGGWKVVSCAFGNCGFATKDCANSTSCNISAGAWTPTPSDYSESAKWQVVVNATAKDLSLTKGGAWCSGNPMVGGTWNRCDPVNKVSDVLTVNLAPPTHSISGKIYRDTSAGACTVVGSNISSSGSKVTVTYKDSSGVTTLTAGPVDVLADGTYMVPSIPNGSLISNVCFTNPSNPDPNYSYAPACPILGRSGTCLNYSPLASFTTDWVDVNMGYVLNGPSAWKVTLGGDVYAGGSISMNVPAFTAGGFTGYFINQVSYGGYAFSSGDQNVGVANNRITANGGYEKLLGATGLWPVTWSAYKEPSGLVSTNNLNNLNPAKAYSIDKTVLDGILASASTYSLIPSATDGVVVIYVKNSNAFPLTFGGNLREATGSANKRILFVAEGDVTFSTSLTAGISPTTATRANIEAGVLSYGDVNFPTLGGTPAADASLIVEGPVISKKNIYMRRDRGDSNTYPAEIIRYSNQYLNLLTKTQRSLPANQNFSGVFVNNIRWEFDK